MRRLHHPVGVDDHVRPDLPLWRRVQPPLSLVELVVDGEQVVETDTLFIDEYLRSGTSVHHEWTGDGPVADALERAGYRMDEVE